MFVKRDLSIEPPIQVASFRPPSPSASSSVLQFGLSVPWSLTLPPSHLTAQYWSAHDITCQESAHYVHALSPGKQQLSLGKVLYWSAFRAQHPYHLPRGLGTAASPLRLHPHGLASPSSICFWTGPAGTRIMRSWLAVRRIWPTSYSDWSGLIVRFSMILYIACGCWLLSHMSSRSRKTCVYMSIGATQSCQKETYSKGAINTISMMLNGAGYI